MNPTTNLADDFFEGWKDICHVVVSETRVTILRRPKERIGTCCTTTFSKETRRWHTRTIK
jgi:hypothetical protein